MKLAISSGLRWLMAFTKAWAIEADTISIILAEAAPGTSDDFEDHHGICHLTTLDSRLFPDGEPTPLRGRVARRPRVPRSRTAEGARQRIPLHSPGTVRGCGCLTGSSNRASR